MQSDGSTEIYKQSISSDMTNEIYRITMYQISPELMKAVQTFTNKH